MKALLVTTLLVTFAGKVNNGFSYPQTGTPTIIVLFGESNSGGLASNQRINAQEWRPRLLPIMNNNTGLFEPLKIGKNNLRKHYGLEYAYDTAHGMENELANQHGFGVFKSCPTYLVKAGQGGSTTLNWDGSTYYRDTLYQRVDRACSLVQSETGKVPQLVFMLSLGINERFSTPAATYKTNIQSIIAGVKSNFSGKRCLFGLMQFQFVGTMTDYDTKMTEISAADTTVFTFSTADCQNIGDGIHLNYFGFKTCTQRFVDSLIKRL